MLDAILSLFGKADPTRDWPPYNGRPLAVDLAGPSLNGVPLGRPIQELRFLGPAENKQDARRGSLGYGGLGLNINIHRGRFDAMSVIYADESFGPAKPFLGAVTFEGRAIDLKNWSLQAAVELLGEPESTDTDDEESVLTWNNVGGSTTLQAEFDLQGRFECMHIWNEDQ